MRKTLLALAVSSIASALALPVPVHAISSYYTAQSCSACHGASPTTCNGCHHHGGSPSISGAQASYAPGATISVTINGGSQSGWVRGAILDASNKVVATTTKTAYPVTVTATAPTTPGTYTWKGAWYGNGYDSGGVIGGGSSTFLPDPNNANHGFEPRSFTFTVSAPAAPSASLSAASLAFGNVTVGGTKSLTASVRNTGTASLSVTGITPCSNTQPPFSINPAAAFTVAAGGSQTLTVGFAPTSTGSYSGCYNLATNDAAHPTLRLDVTGAGTAVAAPSATLTPASLSFASVTVGQSATLVATVGNTGTAALSVTGVTTCDSSSSAAFTVSPAAAFTVAAGGNQALSVKFAPTASGAVAGCWNIATNDPAHATLQLRASGTGAAVVPTAPVATLAPTSLAFGSVTVGQTKTMTASVGNTGNASLSVTSVAACDATTAAAFTVSPTAAFTVAAGGSQVLSVKFAPTAAGTFAGCWNVTTNDPAHAALQLRASATGAAAPATDGATLYAQNCSSCHGALASSSVKGATASQIQNAISSNKGGMGSLSGLTSTQIQAIAGALAGTTTPPPPPPPSTDGAALYTQYCASCHGALSSSSVRGASASKIQNAISSNKGGMGKLSSLTSAQIQAISTALGGTTTTPPPTTGSCTSCHLAPPDTGRHVMHVKEEHVSCASCHGTGYDPVKQTVNTTTHRDGKVQLRSSLNWSSSNRTCAPACHGRETWSYSSSGGGDDGDDHDGVRGDDIAVVDDAAAAGGCASTGIGFTVMVFLGLALSRLVRRGARA
ncbi:MAG TPA: choice-of-anchor D domain-containing protein [Anaeromyxobacteraceae bacterium]|nr:choice-of-anchor D domain-containing protein [Anaeromyxobacteraceae bacterium]